jgi:prepilin-type N-terminal cleavage/methylation domain-containing protein
MKRKQNKNGLTIMEILVAVAIMAILAAGLYFAGHYVETQAKIKLTESTIETLVTAIDEYHDFYGKFPFEADKYYNRGKLQSNDSNGLNGDVTNNAGTVLPAADYNDVYASSEAMYHFLNKCPGSKKIVNSINVSLITNKDNKNREYFFKFNSGVQVYPLMHIIDSWKTPLRYTYVKNTTKQDNFPVITSAGPDGKFGDRGPTDNDPNKARDNINSR